MYRVAVVDDEDVIVAGLVRTMPWENYGCEIVATASDGIAALGVLRKERPDILFTDIQMPGQDGLAMIAAIRSEFPEMQVTILSGYPNFEYAQRAISLGVVRYVLKPSRFSELESALSVMVQNLDALRAPGGSAQAPAVPSDLPANISAAPAPDNVSVQPAAGCAENAHNFIVHNAKEYIRAHYAEKLTLEDVADHVYVSQWHLSKLISRCTNQSFSELLNGVRIEKAQALLADPALRIWEISERVGFADVTHFSRIFKKITGVSANEYRAQNFCAEPAPQETV
ncbi:MAG: response regulator [Faecalibacterium sp.]|nr:response regulator [Faecalibacterium sp.]